MNKCFWVIIVFVLTAQLLHAAFLPISDMPQLIARGNLASSAEVSRFAPFNQDGEISISACYCVPYGLAELSRQFIAVSLPVFEHEMFISVENFGNEIYRENSLLAAYTVCNSQFVTLTPAAMFYSLTSDENNYTSVSSGLFLRFEPTEELELVSSALNVLATPLAEETHEANYQLSCRYKPEHNISFYSGIEKDQNVPAVVKLGCEVRFLDKIRLISGYNFEPALYTGGFDLELGSWRFAYAFAYHEILGLSQCGGLTYILR